MIDVTELKRKKLEELKLLCKNLGLKYSGNKPVLLGRLIAYYTSGSADGANKRSADDLYEVFQEYLGTKRKKSAQVHELERDKTKSKYNYAIKGERTDFRRYIELVFGLPEVTPSVNFIGEALRTEYDGQTKEQFTSALMTCQHKLLAAAFSAHRYFTEDLVPSIHFPSLAILVIRETNFTDLGLESLLFECPKLRVLDIALTQIRGTGLRDIATKCPLLESIEIYHPLELGIAMPYLSKCSLIHTIAGVECYDLDDELISLLVNMPNLVNCRITYSLFDRPTRITEKGIALLRKKPGLERIDFPAEKLLDSISDPASDTAPTSLSTSTTSITPSSDFDSVTVKTSPPSSPLSSSQSSLPVSASDIMPQFQVRKAIMAPKEIKVFDPVGHVSFDNFRRALRLIPALTALDLCAPTCSVEKVDSADSPHVSRLTRLGLAQQSELTDKAILALRSFTALRELNLSFCVSHHQYSQLYPQHLLQPSAFGGGWGSSSSLASLSFQSYNPRASTPNTTTTTTTSAPTPSSPLPNPSQQQQQQLQQILLQRINQNKPPSSTTSVSSSVSSSLSPSPSLSSSPSLSPSLPLTTQQLLQQRLQQRIQQRSELENSQENPSGEIPGSFPVSKTGNLGTQNGEDAETTKIETDEIEAKSEANPTSESEATELEANTNGEKEKEDITMTELNDTQATSPPNASPPSTTTSASLVSPPTQVTPPSPSSTVSPPAPYQQPLITAESILSASVGWSVLETLYLDGIIFSPRVVNQILANCKNVRTVSLNACGNVLDNLLNGPPVSDYPEFQRIGLRILHTKKK